MLRIREISVNGVKNPLFLPCDGLRISWVLESDRCNVRQVSRRIRLDSDTCTVWDSGILESAQSVAIPLPLTLPPRTDFRLTVSVTDSTGETAEITHSFATALNPGDWSAVWIRARRPIEGWAPYLRTKFELRPVPVRTARLYVSGLGCGEYYINGRRLSEDMIDPPMTNYEREVLYRVYDVSGFLPAGGGRCALAALLGEGWYAQSRVWGVGGFKYGDPCLCAQLEILYEDGQRQTVCTDTENWTCKNSPVVLNNLYGGETYDARLETPDFSAPDGDEDGWSPVEADPVPKGTLKLCLMPPVRIIRTLRAQSVKQVSGRDDGAWIIDMGENTAGIAEFHLRPSSRGAQYVFRFAETINPDGSLDFRSIGSFATQCIQQDVYIARGDAQGEVYRPRFTYHAYRYVEITGYFDLRKYGMNPDTDIAVGLVLSTDLEQAGSFRCSDEDINKLQGIMMSTFRSNYHGFPEDCPGREKCGWLGDAQVVCNTGIMNYQMQSSYEKYLHDIRTEKEVYGVWQMIAPGKRGCGEASPLWGCAQVLIPYWMYRYYGDRAVVDDNWDLMCRWVEHEAADAKDFIITRGLGDWCPPVGKNSDRRIPVPESSTQMFYEICCRMRELSEELGLPGGDGFGKLASDIKEAYIRAFWLPDEHRYSTWGSCGVALETGLYPDGEHDSLVKALTDLILADDCAMSTGIYGNKYLIPALCDEGYGDLALRILFNRRHTSFGTMMDDGATSLFECLETKCIGQPRERGTVSLNHPMHAGFAYFLYRCAAGIRPLTPGFSEFEIRPDRFEGISSVDASYETPYGTIEVSFARQDSGTVYRIRIPVNTTCRFSAGGHSAVYGSGSYTVTVSE